MRKTSLLLLLIFLAFTPAQTYAAAEDNYELASKAFREGKENDAFIHVKNSLQENPSHLPSRLLLSELYFNAGNIPAAEHELKNALDLGADINLVLPLLGTTLILQKKVEELLVFERRVNEFSPRTQFEWALLLGQAYLLEGSSNLAEAEFEKASKMYPNDIRAMNTLAAVYARIGKVSEADRLITKSLQIEPDSVKSWHLKGEIEQRKGDRQAALDAFHRAHELDKDDPKVLRSLAAIYLKQGDMDEVRKYLELIRKQTPNDPTAGLIDAWLMLSDNDVKAAEEALAQISDQISLVDSKHLEQHSNLLFIQGAAEYIRGNLEKAKTLLLSYLEKVPTDIGATQLLVDIYLKTGQSRRAIEYLESRKPVIARSPALSVKLAELYIADNKLINAERLLNQMNISFGQLPISTLLQARIEKQRGRLKEALEILETGKFGSEPPLAYHLLKGELELQQGKIDQARKTATGLMKNHADNTDALNLLVAVEIRSNQPQQALTHIDEILTREPGQFRTTWRAESRTW